MKEIIKNAFNTVVNFVKEHKTESIILGVSVLGLTGATVIKVKTTQKKDAPAIPETTTEQKAEETEEKENA